MKTDPRLRYLPSEDKYKSSRSKDIKWVYIITQKYTHGGKFEYIINEKLVGSGWVLGTLQPFGMAK